MPATLRHAARAVGGAVCVAGAVFAWTRAARFTWSNSGLTIDYPETAAWAALAATAGAALVAAAVGRRARAVCAVVAVAAFCYGLELARFRIGIEDAGASQRGLFGATSLPWPQVSRVETGSRLIVVWGLGDDHVRIDAGGFPPQDRARLERTLARRVRERQAR
jgi:hypothetical protein